MQIVGYETAEGDGPAALRLASNGRVERERLSVGATVAYSLGDRRCAGREDGGEHAPCDLSTAPYCDRHADRWACARCTGECDLPLASCQEEHAVYLAAFAPATFKVGVTRSWRLDTRLREQGADRGAHLRTVENGRIARQIEGEIAADVGDRVQVATKRRGLHRSVDEAAWNRLLADFDPIETQAFDYGLDLDDQPVAETMLTGTIRGSKGRLLVLERNNGTYAVDMRALVGYDVEPGETDRALQSSLGAFD